MKKSTTKKHRPPRIYRAKDGRPYIRHKRRRVYLNFGKKTNEMSTLNIIKLFLKYINKKKSVSNKSRPPRKPKNEFEKPERENREKVNIQINNYLRDKYEKINEMDKIEDQKRKEVKEQAEEKKKEDEAKQRQELKDAKERERDIKRAIDREKKLQAELKADRTASRNTLRQLTASNDRVERLIEEGKHIARDVEERAIVEAIPIVDEPILQAIPIEDAPRRPRLRIKAKKEKKEREKKERRVRDGGVIVGEVEVEDKSEEKKRSIPPPPPGKPPPKKEKKTSKDIMKEMGEIHAEVVSEKKSLQKDLAKTKRDAIIDKMFGTPIAYNTAGKLQPKRIILNLRKIGYDVEEVRNRKNRLNEKETVKRFLKNNPEDFDLGLNDKHGWSNLLLTLGSKMNIVNKEKELKEKEAKEKEVKESKDSKDNKYNPESSLVEVGDNDSVDDLAAESDEEDPDQSGIGAWNIKEECMKIIDKLKVREIKKLMNRTHMNNYRKKYKHKGKVLKSNYMDALFLAMEDDAVRVLVCKKINGQVGKGNDVEGKGLTTTQIEEIMKGEGKYIGTVASDEIKTLNPKGSKYGFIMNTDKASQPGQHWIAVYVDLKGDKTVEVYDPLGTYEPTKEFLEQIKTLVDKANLDYYLLLKVNKIKRQSDTSDTCGWFGVKFLKERFRGNRFKFSTGFTELKEDEIQKYKKQNGYGFDTFI